MEWLSQRRSAATNIGKGIYTHFLDDEAWCAPISP
jgi:hypothetical protein